MSEAANLSLALPPKPPGEGWVWDSGGYRRPLGYRPDVFFPFYCEEWELQRLSGGDTVKACWTPSWLPDAFNKQTGGFGLPSAGNLVLTALGLWGVWWLFSSGKGRR